VATQTTLCIVKPNAVEKQAVGKVLAAFEGAGLGVVGLRMERLPRESCEAFYAEHQGKPFFQGLLDFMCSGPVVLVALRGENAIESARSIMGATDPAQAAPGTLRAALGDNVTRNAVHGSDSPASAAREVRFFFPELGRAGSPEDPSGAPGAAG
jgi:nucleoside-diphosphate kinase